MTHPSRPAPAHDPGLDISPASRTHGGGDPGGGDRGGDLVDELVDELATLTGPEESDAEALARFVAGDPDGLAVLVDRHQEQLVRAAWRVLGNEHDARDAVQAAWCAVVRTAAGFRGESTVGSWLWRIVRNAALNQLRRRLTRPMPASAEAVVYVDDIRHVSGDGEAEQADARIVVDELLAGLPVEQRVAVVLVDLCGLSIADAATRLGVAEGTVKSRRGRARAAMAAHLRGGSTSE